MKSLLHSLQQHKVRAGVALTAAIGLIFALTTLAAPGKKVTNGQLVFRTSLPNQTVNFKCTGGQQKTVRTYNQGQGHWYAGPFSVTSAKAGDKRSCSIQIVVPSGYQLVAGNQPQLTRDVKAGDRQIVNWNFQALPKPAPSDSPSPPPTPTPSPTPTDDTETSPPEKEPDQVIIVPAEPAPDSAPAPDVSQPEPDPPAADPGQDLTIPEPDEPVQEDEPGNEEPEEPPEPEAESLDEDVGNLGGFSADEVASTPTPGTAGGSSSLSGGANQDELAGNLPGISPTPSADVAADRATIPAWQQWLLVLVILGGVGALAYFGLKYYRENQV